MKRILQRTFLLSTFNFLSLSFWAQIPQSPSNLQSPNVASLGVYGEFPVSFFTGTPSIGIPLYDLQLKHLKVPISMDYHSSSVRPDQHPSWVGLGWSLQAGGVIYRIVSDVPDDYNNPNYSVGGKDAGYYYNHNVLNRSDWNHRDYLRRIAQYTNDAFKDTSPDEFSFSFCGYSGKFYLNHEGQWEVQCNKPLKVLFDGEFIEVPFDKEGTRANIYGYSKVFSGFTLIGEDGTQYRFGGVVNAIEFSNDFFRQYWSDWIANAWHLTKITCKNGETVHFHYDRGDFINQMYISVYENLGSFTESKGGLFNPQPECSFWNKTSIPASYKGQLISPIYLKKIETKYVNILFDRVASNELNFPESAYSWQHSLWSRSGGNIAFLPILKSHIDSYPDCLKRLKWYKLSNIQVLDNRGTVLRKIQFSYNDNPNERLFLNSISEETANQAVRKHTFEYNQAHRLPGYLSNQIDHWGYYNATYASISDHSSYYQYREANPSVSGYGVLSKIIHPTGGYTRFVFEPHQYRKQVKIKRWEGVDTFPSNRYAGGVRIKKIIQSDTGHKSDERTEKEYYYTTDYISKKENSSNSSGVLGGHIAYYFTNYVVEAFNDDGVRRRMSIFSSQSVLPACQNTQNSHIGYSHVTERYHDGSFKSYVFSNFDNGFLDESSDAIIQQSRTPYEDYASKQQERGVLLQQDSYDSNSKLKSRQIYTYQKDKSTNLYVRSMKARFHNVCPNTAVSYDEGCSYKIYTYTMLLSSEKTLWYDNPDSPLSLTISYEYNSHKLPCKITTLNSRDEKDVILTRYSGDFNTGIYGGMRKVNMLNFPIERLRLRNGRIFEAELHTYRQKDYYDYVLDKSYRTHFKTPVLEKDFTFFNGAAVGSHYGFPEKEYLKYDSRNNLLEERDRSGKYTTYRWGYNNLYPIAVFENARNDYKSTPKYQDVRKSESFSLKHDRPYLNTKSCVFYTSREGDVEVRLPGCLGFNWYVTGDVDGRHFSLVSIRGSDKLEVPWSNYQKVYKYKVVLKNVPAGRHTFWIRATDSQMGPYAASEEDEAGLGFSYWSRKELPSEESGFENIFYENFEPSGRIPFGYHSAHSHEGAYIVTLRANPNERYYIDYRVFRSGKWEYVRDDFRNGTHTIDEGHCPIDDIRVYPVRASVLSFTHFPSIGLRSRTDTRGFTESYEYDSFGRLLFINDTNGKRRLGFNYRYYDQPEEIAPPLYRNVEQRSSFTSKRCDRSLGEMSESVEYVVPAGKYTSTISQEDANRKALEDLQNNGQQYADENAKCISHIIVSVYNPTNESYILEYAWGAHGSIKTPYAIPPGRRIADTGDVLRDYQPTILYVPRINYRWIHITRGVPGEFIPLSIKSYPHGYDIFYDTSYYSDYKDTYVIGNYSFPD